MFMLCVAANELIVSHLAVPLVPRPPAVNQRLIICPSYSYQITFVEGRV